MPSPLSMSFQPSAAILVLNYNGRHHLEQCLPSLARISYPRAAVTVVDNGSTDDSLSFVQARHPDVAVLALGENRGFAPSYNIAVRESKTDLVVFLNNDTRVEPDWLDQLVEVPLPDATAQQQILALARVRAEQNAGRALVAELDYRVLLPPMGGMSGGEIRDLLRRALEEKVHTAGQGQDPGLVTTQDLLRQVDVYRRIRAVVEKIRYGQYL